jgi:hypothetical protein
LLAATGISADGMTISGVGVNPDGQIEAWIARLDDREVYAVGDANCDGSIDFDDIDAFVLGLANESEYEATYPQCDVSVLDVNRDGRVDFDDIDVFVECIAGGECP